MKKFVLLLVVLPVLLSVDSACQPGYIEASLGQEFALAIGEKARITGENLEIRFKEVIEDSRCSKDVVCIWEGRVVCLLEITQDGVLNEITLTQPGFTDHATQESLQGYTFTFNIEPYPEEADEQIISSEYSLLLTLSQS